MAPRRGINRGRDSEESNNSRLFKVIDGAHLLMLIDGASETEVTTSLRSIAKSTLYIQPFGTAIPALFATGNGIGPKFLSALELGTIGAFLK